MQDTWDFEDRARQGKPASLRGPFRRAVVHGLGVVLPPLLTIVFFLWAWNLISAYVLEPVEDATRHLIVTAIWDVRREPPSGISGRAYQRLGSGEWIPSEVHDAVKGDPGGAVPPTAQGYYDRYVDLLYLQRTTVVPLFLAVFVLVLYLLGKFFGAGIGRWIWSLFEAFIERLPVIRNVYSSVKQVTDYVIDERRTGFSRVVAVEYPRRGIWAIAFVTGEGLLDVCAAANEPVLSVLIPTSPVPGTGFAAMVRKSEAVDLDMTVDQALQFIVSCGVVVPLQQQPREGAALPAAGPAVAAHPSKLPSQPSSSRPSAED